MKTVLVYLTIRSLRRGVNSKRGAYLKLCANLSIYGNLETRPLAYEHYVILRRTLTDFAPFIARRFSKTSQRALR